MKFYNTTSEVQKVTFFDDGNMPHVFEFAPLTGVVDVPEQWAHLVPSHAPLLKSQAQLDKETAPAAPVPAAPAAKLAHKVADTANTVAAAVPTSLATAHTFLNEIKADYNTHRASTTYHYNADSTNTISSADSTDQSSANTLANELKTDLDKETAPAAPVPAAPAAKK